MSAVRWSQKSRLKLCPFLWVEILDESMIFLKPIKDKLISMIENINLRDCFFPLHPRHWEFLCCLNKEQGRDKNFMSSGIHIGDQFSPDKSSIMTCISKRSKAYCTMVMSGSPVSLGQGYQICVAKSGQLLTDSKVVGRIKCLLPSSGHLDICSSNLVVPP